MGGGIEGEPVLAVCLAFMPLWLVPGNGYAVVPVVTDIVRYFFEDLFNPGITLAYLRTEHVIQVEGLSQFEQVVFTPDALERLDDILPAGFNAPVGQSGQLFRIALALQDGFDDQHPGFSCYVGYDMVQLLYPLAVLDVRLAARNIFYLPGIDQVNVKAVLFQYQVGLEPVHAGRFHRDRVNTARLEPGCHLMQIGSETAEFTHVFTVPIRGNGHVVHSTRDVDAGRVQVHYFENVV